MQVEEKQILKSTAVRVRTRKHKEQLVQRFFHLSLKKASILRLCLVGS
ncbi:hypothetical protein LLB_1789 [Legionella longbeachae D-4968]|nr:hypothetical protein LLB_1789 [Legionella longbeachae D-4968]